MEKDNDVENNAKKDVLNIPIVEPIKRKKISEKELYDVLSKHSKWLKTDGQDGERANLSQLDLSGIYIPFLNLRKAICKRANFGNMKLSGNFEETIFTETNFENSIFQMCNLNKTNLSKTNCQNSRFQMNKFDETNFREANLNCSRFVANDFSGAILENADMKNAYIPMPKNFNKANIKYVNLEGATGLLGNEFAQTDVTGTILSDGIKEFKSLEIVEKTSENARKIFFAMLLGCVYSWLTIATTTDVRLLTNSASSPLPIIGTEIPIAWFYIAAPLLLICLYFYFHLYLIKLWEALSGLPAIFPDGKRLDERAYPWLLNGLVRRHFRLLEKDRPFTAHVQEWITILLSWWVVPITMIAFWLRFIPRHDWWGTCFHIGLIVISVGFAIIFYRLCALTLKNEKISIVSIKRFQYDKRPILGTCVLLVGMIFLMLSYGSIEGDRKNEKIKNYNLKEAVPKAFQMIGFDVFANFREKSVSEIPSNYGQITKEERIGFVKGANLKGRNLNNADMYQSYLVRADFRKAFLKKAILIKTNLKNANLEGANLQNANLFNANLQEAILKGANLQNANLGGANLIKSNLESANLMGAALISANMYEANLDKANLKEANLIKANLFDANLEGANLLGSKLNEVNFKGADLQNVNLKDANLQYAELEGNNLKGANLEGANLQNSILGCANLQEVFLKNANLQNANLKCKYYGNKTDINIDNLCQVKTLYNSSLDDDLMEQVNKYCPHLLEEPK